MTKSEIAKNILLKRTCETCFAYWMGDNDDGSSSMMPVACIYGKDPDNNNDMITCEKWELDE